MKAENLIGQEFRVERVVRVRVARFVCEYHYTCVQMDDGTYELLFPAFNGEFVFYKWANPEIHKAFQESTADPVLGHGIGLGYTYAGIRGPVRKGEAVGEPLLVKIISNEQRSHDEDLCSPSSPAIREALRDLGLIEEANDT